MSASTTFLIVLLVLALGLASCATAGAAVVLCWRWAAGYRSAAREAAMRAALAETALAQMRQKRSVAVGKGNRTRDERNKNKVRTTTAAIREAIVEKQKPPQGALALMVTDAAVPEPVLLDQAETA